MLCDNRMFAWLVLAHQRDTTKQHKIALYNYVCSAEPKMNIETMSHCYKHIVAS